MNLDANPKASCRPDSLTPSPKLEVNTPNPIPQELRLHVLCVLHPLHHKKREASEASGRPGPLVPCTHSGPLAPAHTMPVAQRGSWGLGLLFCQVRKTSSIPCRVLERFGVWVVVVWGHIAKEGLMSRRSLKEVARTANQRSE